MVNNSNCWPMLTLNTDWMFFAREIEQFSQVLIEITCFSEILGPNIFLEFCQILGSSWGIHTCNIVTMPPSAEFGIIRDIIVYYFKIFKFFLFLKEGERGQRWWITNFKFRSYYNTCLRKRRKCYLWSLWCKRHKFRKITK